MDIGKPGGILDANDDLAAGPVALIVLQPPGGSASLIERMAATLTWRDKR